MSTASPLSFLAQKRRSLNMQPARFRYQVPQSIFVGKKKSQSPNLGEFESLLSKDDIREFQSQAGASLALVNKMPENQKRDMAKKFISLTRADQTQKAASRQAQFGRIGGSVVNKEPSGLFFGLPAATSDIRSPQNAGTSQLHGGTTLNYPSPTNSPHAEQNEKWAPNKNYLDQNEQDAMMGQLQKLIDKQSIIENNEQEQFERKYRNAELYHNRVLSKHEHMVKFKNDQKSFHESYKQNEVVVLPSLDLPTMDMVPRVDIIEDNLKIRKKKRNNNKLSSIFLVRQKNAEFISGCCQIAINRMEKQGKVFDKSDSMQVKREIGFSKFNRELLKKAEDGLSSDDDGLGVIPEEGTKQDQMLDQATFREVIRNAIILRDEERALQLAKEKEKTRNEMNTIKQTIRQLSTVDARSMTNDQQSVIKVLDDSQSTLSRPRKRDARGSIIVSEPHKDLINNLPDNFSDTSIVESYSALKALQDKNRKLTKTSPNSLLREGRIKIGLVIDQIKGVAERKKLNQKLNAEQKQINELIERYRAKNVVQKVKKKVKDTFGSYREDDSVPSTPTLEDQTNLMTSFQNGLPDIHTKNRYNLDDQNFQNLQKTYLQKLQDLELQILQDNKEHVMMQQIMDMVDPSEEVEHSLHHQLKEVADGKIAVEDVDTSTIQNLGASIQSLQGKKFFDPEINEDKLFTKMSLRAANKKKAKELLEKVRNFKNRKNMKRRATLYMRFGIDPDDSEAGDRLDDIMGTELSNQKN